MDGYQSMRTVLVHLIEVHGYRRIAFVTGLPRHSGHQERYHAYVDTLAEYGLPLNQKLVFRREWAGNGGVDSWPLDELKDSVEAIVGVDDFAALRILRGLQSRGVQIPRDVAVVGFDDDVESKTTMPPLTTVRPPFYEMGQRAVEMLLALIEGEQVPERVTLPSTLVVRRSCGCESSAVAQAAAKLPPAADLVRANQEELNAVLTMKREKILAGMAQATGGLGNGINPAWAGQLLDSFAAEMGGKSTGTFLATLDEILRQVVITKGDVPTWHGALSTLRQHTLPHLQGNGYLTRAENLWHQARVAIGEAAQHAHAHQALQCDRQIQFIYDISQLLSTSTDIETLTDIMAGSLPQLGIPSCYLSLYQDPTAPTEWSRLVLAYSTQGRFELEPGGQCFPSRRLIPEEMQSQERQYSAVVLPLFFREQQLGLVVFEVGPSEGRVYQLLHQSLNSALYGMKLIQRVERHARDLEARNAELDAFVHTVAHDLKNPLGLIIGYADTAELDFVDLSPGEIKRCIEAIARNGRRTANIVDALLLLSSVRKEEVKTEPIDMADVAAEAQNQLAQLITERQAEITAPDEWPGATGYAPWVERVWVNYISNAVKYGGQPDKGLPPRIELGFDEPVGSRVRFWVHDNGPGLTPQEQAGLFTPFTRLHRVRAEGHGLGLSIVQRIIEKLNGEVGVVSKAGNGSTFYFALPSAQAIEH